MQRQFGTEISGNRAPGAELSAAQRSGILSAVESGKSKGEVARIYQCNPKTVYDTIKRYNNTGTIKSLPGRGRRGFITDYDRRQILRIVRAEPTITYDKILEEIGNICCRRTIYRVLKDSNITNWIAKNRPFLTEEIAAKRLAFCIQMTGLPFHKIWYSDECSYIPGEGKPTVRVFRTPKQKWEREMINAVRKSGRLPAYMIWAAFTYNRRTELIHMQRGESGGYNAQSYQEALEEGLLPVYQPGNRFQQDNAPIHTAYSTKEWMEKHGIWTIEWPPNSPDINPIEHAWFLLKRELYKRHPTIHTLGQSQAAIHTIRKHLSDAWRELDHEILQRLIDSMPRRLAAVIAAGGWHTKY